MTVTTPPQTRPSAPSPSARVRSRGAVMRSLVAWSWQAAPRQMLQSSLLVGGAAVCSTLYPVGIALVVDAVTPPRFSRLVLGVVLIATMYTVNWLLSMQMVTAVTKFCDLISLQMSSRIAELVNRAAGVEHFERPDYLAELDLLDQDRRQLALWARHLAYISQGVMHMLGVGIVFAVIYPPLAVLPLCVVAPVVGEWLSARLRERLDRRLVAERRLIDAFFSLVTQPSSAKEVRVFGLREMLVDRHRGLASRVQGQTRRAAVNGGLIAGLGWLVFAAAFITAVAIAAVRALHGEATAGQVLLAALLMQRAQLQLGPAATAVEQLIASGRTARRMLWLEDYAEDDRRRHHGVSNTSVRERDNHESPPSSLTRGITFEGVGFTYPGTGKVVLEGIDLVLPAGSAVALVGENGAGKTTLVKLLTGMYEPTSGRIMIDGVPLSDMDIEEWRTRTSAAFQDFVRPQLLAGQTVGLGDLPRIDDNEALRRALERADATAVIDELPNGFATKLGRSFAGGQDLSGGQWQRLALGRAMMRDSPLLHVFDEPTASLDPITEAGLFDRYISTFRDVAARCGAITLLVSHRFSTVRMADQIVVLENGRIVENGDHDSLIAANGHYAELFEMQARAYR